MSTKINKVLEWFYDNPRKKLTIRELSRTIDISPAWISKAIKENSDIIRFEKFGNSFIVDANFGTKYKQMKMLHNLKNIFDSGITDYIKKELFNPTIVLFGSYAKGENYEDSDIDLFIESPEEVIDLSKFERKLGYEIHVTSNGKLSNVPNKHLLNNIIDGITLNGSIWLKDGRRNKNKKLE